MMFGTQTRLFVATVIVALFAATVYGATYTISASFVERREAKPNSSMSGTLFYYYDSAVPKNCRLLMEYALPGGSVKNVYYYEDEALYSMCTEKCTGIKISELPDPWYADANVYKTSESGTMRWYERKEVTASSQVKRIYMTSGLPTDSGYTVSQVEFCDGRSLTLSNFQYLKDGVDANMFKRGSDCPKPTCPIFADIVFVLDSSGSVSPQEWSQLADFVIAVMDSFTFGDDGVAAACIQFNGNGAKNCDTKSISGCGTRYHGDCSWKVDTIPNDKSANILAGATVEGQTIKTVSTDKAALVSVMSQYRKPNGQTCQGFGLELAQTVLDLSPRRNLVNKPNVIVIAVTDGVDFCPNRTKKAADDLRKNYDALVVEVGVGLSSCGKNYDKNFLMSVASTLGTEPAYYDVDDFDAIKKVADDLFKPVCQQYTSDCPNCPGFCGCGKCFCPDCDDSGSTCHSNTCEEREGTSTGCVTNFVPCDLPVDACRWYTCDGSKEEGQGRCNVVLNQCEDMKKAYPGKCREVSCDPSVDGGCYVTFNDNYCKKEFGSNKCFDFVCTPDGEDVDPAYAESGCKLVLNKTAEKEEELRKSGELACFEPTCDPTTGETDKKDLCQSRLSTPLCHTSSCQKVKVGDNEVFDCINKERPHKATTRCTKYVCNETTNGWIDETIDDIDSCTEKFENDPKYDMRCLTAHCDDDLGCVVENVTGCSTECNASFIKKCIREGYEKSSVTECWLMSCDARQSAADPSIWEPYCKDELHVNCLDNETLVKKAADDSDNSTQCCQVVCSVTGTCDVECDDYPSYPVDDECMYWVCLEQSKGHWKWVYNATETNYTCHDDACSVRACHPVDGCAMVTETCASKTTNCTTYTCEVDAAGNKQCVARSLLVNSTCKHEYCDEETDSIVRIDYLDDCKKMAEYNKCLNPSCVYDAKNKTSTCKFTARQPDGNDPCIIYTCDPETGIFTQTPKCDDGLYCTEDHCTIFGECRNNPIRCSEKLDMIGYSCFEARCKEDPDNKRYKCMRKLIRNAYIDVCGNCIIENATSDEASAGSASILSEESIDTVSCTGAPAKPLLTEGLAAASIALIILAAVIIGAGLAASGVVGTKTLIDRAKGANNQSAHSNPLFEESETELSNPTYAGNN